MKTEKNRTLCAVVGLMVIAGATLEAAANSANVSCGQPTKQPAGGGSVMVLITFADKSTCTWTAGGILKTDTPQEKAAKIRAAAPPAHAKLETDAASGTVAGGTVNTVSATSKAGSTIKSMGFKLDDTGEKERPNVFVAVADHKGLASLSGVATALDGDDLPGLVSVTASGVTALVNTTVGMTAEQIEDDIIAQLTTGGVSAELADAGFIASYYPGAEGDGRVISINDIDANGLETQATDTGLVMDVSALIDTRWGDIPTVSEWGLIVMALLAVVAGGVLYGRRRIGGIANSE